MKTIAEIEELSNMVLQAEKDSILSTNEAVAKMYFYSKCIDVIKMFNGNADHVAQMLYNYEVHLQAITEDANILIAHNLSDSDAMINYNHEISECKNVIILLKFR